MTVKFFFQRSFFFWPFFKNEHYITIVLLSGERSLILIHCWVSVVSTYLLCTVLWRLTDVLRGIEDSKQSVSVEHAEAQRARAEAWDSTNRAFIAEQTDGSWQVRSAEHLTLLHARGHSWCQHRKPDTFTHTRNNSEPDSRQASRRHVRDTLITGRASRRHTRTLQAAGA